MPVIGQFRYGRKYRITRGTWINDLNNSTLCPYASVSQTIMITPPGEAKINPTNSPVEIGTVETPGDILNEINELKARSENLWLNYNQMFTLYPTINHGVFQVKSENKAVAINKIEVINITGKVVYTRIIEEKQVERTQEHNINVTDLNKGIYFVRINNSTEFKKIILE
jgi:hypothetical protein